MVRTFRLILNHRFRTNRANTTISGNLAEKATGQVSTNEGGGWTTYTYIYAKPVIVAGTLDTWSVTGNPGETKFSGTVTGSDAVSVTVELDFTGDAQVDGVAVPGSDGNFVFYVTPGKTTVRARLVETILDNGELTRREGAWQTQTISGTLVSSPKALLALDAVGGANAAISGLKIANWQTGVSSLSVMIDVTGDGEHNLTLPSDANGKVSMAAILTAIDNNPTLAAKLHGGLIMVTAWLSGSTAHDENTVTFPIVYEANLTNTQIISCKNTQKEFAKQYVQYETTINGLTQTVETQYYDGPASNPGGSGTGVLTTFDPGLTQSDILKLENAPYIPVPTPNFSGELVAFENDPAVREAMNTVIRTYQQAIISQQAQQYAVLVAGYNADVARLQSAYEVQVARNNAEINATVDPPLDTTGISNQYNALYSNALTVKTTALAVPGLTSSQIAAIENEYEIEFIEITRDETIALANAQYDLLCGAGSAIERKNLLAGANADAQKTMLDNQAQLTKDLNDQISNLLYQQKQAQATAYAAAVNNMYAGLQAAITAWQNSGAAQKAWADYIAALFNSMVARYKADNAAYIANAKAAAGAEQTLAGAINTAWLTAQKDANSEAIKAQKAAIALQKQFVVEVQAAIRDKTIADAVNKAENDKANYDFHVKVLERMQQASNGYNTASSPFISEAYNVFFAASDQDKPAVGIYYAELLVELADPFVQQNTAAKREYYESRSIQEQKFNDKTTSIEATYQHKLIEAIAKYLNGSVDVGADYSLSLLSIAEAYEGVTVGASGGYNGTMIGADQSLQSTLVTNASTQNTADLGSEQTYLDTVMNGYLNAVKSWANGQNNAYGNYVKANAQAAGDHYDTILGAAVSYVTSVFGKGVGEATSNIGTLSGLAGSTAGAISGFLNSWISASYGGERDYVNADKELSKANINAAAQYLTTQASIDYSAQKEQNALTKEYHQKLIDFEMWHREWLLNSYKEKIPLSTSNVLDSYHQDMFNFGVFPGTDHPKSWSVRSDAEAAYANLESSALAAPLKPWKDMQSFAITDNAKAKEKEAYNTYLTAVWGNEQSYLTTCYATASGLFESWYNGLDGLESGVEGADAALLSAARAADTTPDMIAFLTAAAQADVDYASALAANFAKYQKAWRQEQLGTLPSGNPLIPVWQQEIAWVGAVGDARNVYMIALGGAGMAYTNTVLDAYGVFNDAAWSAAGAYNSSANSVGSAYSSAMRSANRTYVQSQFNAEKAHTMALFAAAKEESLANAATELTVAKYNANATQSEAAGATAKIDTLMSLLGNLGQGYTFTNWLSDAQTTSTTLTGDLAAAITARNQRITTGNQQITIAKIDNATTKLAKDNAANGVFWRTLGEADTNVMIAAYGAYTTYVASMKVVQAAYGDAITAAYGTYVNTEVIAWNKYVKQASRLNEAYHSVITQLNIDPTFDGVGHIQQIAASQAGGGTGHDIQPLGGGNGGNTGAGGTNADDGDVFPGPITQWFKRYDDISQALYQQELRRYNNAHYICTWDNFWSGFEGGSGKTTAKIKDIISELRNQQQVIESKIESLRRELLNDPNSEEIAEEMLDWRASVDVLYDKRSFFVALQDRYYNDILWRINGHAIQEANEPILFATSFAVPVSAIVKNFAAKLAMKKAATVVTPATTPKYSPQVVETGDSIATWLGKDAVVKTNKAGDKVFMSQDGLRKFRTDFNVTSEPGHVHLEQLVNGRWRDVTPHHKIFPKGD